MIVRVSLLLLASLAADPPASDGAHLVADLKRRVGPPAWQALHSSHRGTDFLTVLTADDAWLRDLLDSGPVRRADRIVSFLHRLWGEDPGLVQRPVDRSMATACALAMGMANYDADWMAKRYAYYRDSYRDGLLNICYQGLATWERRYLARGVQWRQLSNPEALVFLRDRISWPRRDYPKACWQAPYRSFNCLGDSVQRPDYYMPFHGSFSSYPEMVIKVGGVCGALSNLGASAAMANGIPAATMGEPGHCAYTVKIDDQTWQPSYSLSWKRSLHTSFFAASWPGLMLTEACYSKPTLVHKAGNLARRAHALEAEGELDRADSYFGRAVKAHGLHYDLWLEWASFGERHKKDPEWWQNYHDALLKGLADHEEPAWNLLSKRVYPKLIKDLDSEARRSLFHLWIRGLKSFGGGRWNIEGAWNWMLKQLAAADQSWLVRRMTAGLASSPALGPICVSWLLGRYPAESKERADALKSLLTATRSGNADAVLKELARRMLPDAAKRDDLAGFQSIGKAASRLYAAQPMIEFDPFPGALMSDGGLLQVSDTGNRYDSPEHHWGVLGKHGGHCHTGGGPAFIAVRLERHARLTGLVIQNRPGGNQWRAGGSKVEISDDGKTWTQIGTLKGSKKVYRIDLQDAKHRCLWVRISKKGNCLHINRFLVYGYRRS